MTSPLREQFGAPTDRVSKKVKPFLGAWVKEYIARSPFAVMATSNADGDCDSSPKGGKPGFIKVIDDTKLLIPDIAGNKLFQGYINIESNPKIGLLFMIPGVTVTVRVNGRVRVVDANEIGEMEVFNADENAKVLQGLLLNVDESYVHCPRAFTFSRLWDTEAMAENAETDFFKQWMDALVD